MVRVWIAGLFLALVLGGCTPEAQEAWAPFWNEVARAYVEGPRTPPEPVIEPQVCNIAGNISASGEKIYHLPGMANYKQVVIDEGRGERWFCTEEEAVAAGWRKAQR
jgi:hypothetical protein